MQLTLGRVHLGWCVFSLHNQSLIQTLVDHRFLVTIILCGDSWTLIIILWLNSKPFHSQQQHLLRRHNSSPAPRHRPRDKNSQIWWEDKDYFSQISFNNSLSLSFFCRWGFKQTCKMSCGFSKSISSLFHIKLRLHLSFGGDQTFKL